MDNWVLVVCVVLGACNGPSSTGNPSAPEPPQVEPTPKRPTQISAPFHSIAPDAAAATGPIPSASTQLIISLSDGWTGTDAILRRYERNAGASWQAVGEPVTSTLGNAGLGWGRGLHQQPGGSDPVKHEGDGRSPAGVFRIGHSYGYASPPSGTTLPYQQVDKKWRCVNDADSANYNRVLDMTKTTKDWDDAERMRRRDALYELVIEIDHNHIVATDSPPTPGDGSCIFVHVWRRPGAPTIGCTARPLPAMQELLTWLHPEASPVLVALPAARYEELRAAWNLP